MRSTVWDKWASVFYDFHWIETRNGKETARKHSRNRIAWHIGAKNNARIFYPKNKITTDNYLFQSRIMMKEWNDNWWWGDVWKEPLTIEIDWQINNAPAPNSFNFCDISEFWWWTFVKRSNGNFTHVQSMILMTTRQAVEHIEWGSLEGWELKREEKGIDCMCPMHVLNNRCYPLPFQPSEQLMACAL